MGNATSPYRQKSNETKKAPKIFHQFVICIVIFCALFVISKTGIFDNSKIWKSLTILSEYDVKLEDIAKTFNDAVIYIKDNMVEDKTEVVSDADKMQEDVSNIKDITTVLRPVSGVATSRFGKRVNNDGTEELHTGVDLEAPIGTPIKAAISGNVIEVKELDDSFGKFLRVKNNDIVTTYAHCSSIEVKEGDIVLQGEIIAYSGNTGNVTGPHLHFEITYNGRYVDPGFLLSSE